MRLGEMGSAVSLPVSHVRFSFQVAPANFSRSPPRKKEASCALILELIGGASWSADLRPPRPHVAAPRGRGHVCIFRVRWYPALVLALVAAVAAAAAAAVAALIQWDKCLIAGVVLLLDGVEVDPLLEFACPVHVALHHGHSELCVRLCRVCLCPVLAVWVAQCVPRG